MILQPRSALIRRRSAFTLLEVLVVVAIILVLASVATVAVLNVMRDSKGDTARIQAINLEKSVKMYMAKHTDAPPPQTLQEVIRFIDGADVDPTKLLDPWGQQFQIGYTESGNPYVFTTNGDTGEMIRSDIKAPR
jgi:general secretion pathway protein G